MSTFTSVLPENYTRILEILKSDFNLPLDYTAWGKACVATRKLIKQDQSDSLDIEDLTFTNFYDDDYKPEYTDKVQKFDSAGYERWYGYLKKDLTLRPNVSQCSSMRLTTSCPNTMGLTKTGSLRTCVSLPGRYIVTMDLCASQIRLGAHYSGDEKLITLMETSDDAYVALADLSGTHISHKQAKYAMLIRNFGGSVATQAKAADVSEQVIEDFNRALDSEFPKYHEFCESLYSAGIKNNYIEIPDCLEPIPVPEDRHPGRWAKATWFQATEFMAMLRIFDELRRANVTVHGTVHDELICSCSAREIDTVVQKITNAVTQAFTDRSEEYNAKACRVQYGPSWGEQYPTNKIVDPAPARPETLDEICDDIEDSADLHNSKQLSEYFQSANSRRYNRSFCNLLMLKLLNPAEFASTIARLPARKKDFAKPIIAKAEDIQNGVQHQIQHAKLRATEEAITHHTNWKSGADSELIEFLTTKYQKYTKNTGNTLYHTPFGTNIWEELTKGVLMEDTMHLAHHTFEKAGKVTDITISQSKIDKFPKTVRELLLHRCQEEEMTPKGFAVSNGIIDKSTLKLRNIETADNILKNLISPVEFNESATWETWETFLDGVFADDEDRQQKKDAIQEYIGACLFAETTKYQVHLFLQGHTNGSNGKSVFLKTLEKLFPTAGTTSVSIDQMGEKFTTANLRNSIINIVPEQDEGYIKGINKIKAIFTGDRISAEKKGVQEHVTWTPYGGHLLSVNNLPTMGTTGKAFFRRMTVIRFNRQFSDSEADRDLDTKLENELPGILNWAIEGYARLLVNKGYTDVPSSHVAKHVWQQFGDNIHAFFSDKTLPTTGNDNWLSPKDLYKEYCDYCKDTNRTPSNYTKFVNNSTYTSLPTRKANNTRYVQCKLVNDDNVISFDEVANF